MTEMMTGDGLPGKEVQNGLTALGKALSMYAIYGIDHPVAAQTLFAAYEQFSVLYESHDVLNIGAVGGRFMVNGQPFSSVNSLMKGLERKVIAMGITNLSIRRGLTFEEFGKLVELLSHGGLDEVRDAIDGAAFSNICSEDDVEYRLVHKGESVVDSSSVPAGEAGDEKERGDGAEEDNAPVHVDQIVAFMKGEAAQAASSVQDEIARLASDPEKLGQLIVESVVMRRVVTDLEDRESLGDVVLGCLRKTFDQLKEIEVFQKRSGKASMKKALLLLEKNILERIHEVTGMGDREQDRKILKAIRNMKMDIDIESAIAKYSEQAAAFQRCEEKMAGYVSDRGLADVKKLRHAGDISEDEWRRIEIESQQRQRQKDDAGGGEGSVEMLSGNLAALAVVLEQLDELMKRDVRSEHLNRLLGQAEQSLATHSAQTEAKIKDLGRQISEEDASRQTIEGHAARMTVPELLYSIAEITQELSQPLTAIDVALEMVLTGYVGPVPEQQRDILSLASSSGEQMGYLMEQLKEIVGHPKALGTDKRFHCNGPSVMSTGEERAANS